MSWFGSTKYPQFEEKINEATSESIPNGEIDFATALEVSDMIRSKQVPSKESMRALKKRFMEADNVNTKKSAFKLIDFCIKNGGSHFINEIASKEFMDPLIALLKNSDTNQSLKTYLLGNIQTWSIMVSTNPKYDYINECYKKLQNDGFEFPMINDIIDSNMIDSKVAPEWQDSDACMMCSKMFTFLNRKHHCRSCGGVFCGEHSSKMVELPELGINIPVRVCDNCYSDHKAKKKRDKKHRKNKSVDSTVKKDGSLTDEDDEIKKAIELSLKETATKHSYTPHATTNATITTEYATEDDEEMKAAIAASLQELKGSAESKEPKETSTGLYSHLMTDRPYVAVSNPITHSNIIQNTPEYAQNLSQVQQQQQQYPLQPPQYPVQYQNGQEQGQRQPTQQPQQQPELQPQQIQPDPALFNVIRNSDEKKVVDFIQLLDDQMKSTSQTLNPSLIQLHSDMVLLRPKVSAAISKEDSEIVKFQSLYSKLFVIGRLYDDILQNRLKQEQDMIKIQQTNHSNISSNYISPLLNGNVAYQTQYQNPQLQYISPQSTFGQAPPAIHQLQALNQIQQSDIHTQVSNFPSTSTPIYASNTGIPSSYAVPESIIPQNTYQANQPQLQPSVPPGSNDNTIESKLSSLPSVQYASLPSEPVNLDNDKPKSEPITENIESPVVKPQKEPEIVNLIDL